VLNNLAWRFATDPDATKRNGAEAVQLAEVACTLTAHQNPIPLSILGAAYAEAGRFKEAIETAQKARDLAQAAGQPQLAEKNRQLLELYRSGQACRELPPPANATSEYAR
jgi:tetratricopeptide (TPR) repeat protein